jgi:hypothetical protein
VQELQTAALAFGGNGATGATATEEYNGTLGQQVLSLIQQEIYSRSRTQTAALAFGGQVFHLQYRATEEYDGLLGQQQIL